MVKAGNMTAKVRKLKGAFFDSQIINRYRRREENVDEAPIEMYLKGVGTSGVNGIGQGLWGCRMAPETLSDRLRPVYGRIDHWRGKAVGAHVPLPVPRRCAAQAFVGRGHRERIGPGYDWHRPPRPRGRSSASPRA